MNKINFLRKEIILNMMSSYANRASGVHIFIYMYMINCKMAVRIQLKIGRCDIQISEKVTWLCPICPNPIVQV